MRGFVVMAMFAVSLSHAGSHNYVEVRNLELDASGLSEIFVDAGAGALVVNGIDDSNEIVVIATIVADYGDEDEARELADEQNLIKAGNTIINMGPRTVLTPSLSSIRRKSPPHSPGIMTLSHPPALFKCLSM